MRLHVTLVAAFSAVALVSTASNAQSRGSRSSQSAPQASTPIEFGLDGALNFGLDDPKTTAVSLPVQNLRVGFMRNPVWSIEPFLQLNSIHQSGASATAMNIGTGLLYHFTQNRAEKQWYARPFVGLNHGSASETVGGVTTSTSVNQFQVGGGVGLKVPMADRWGLRFEGTMTHNFKTDAVAASSMLGFNAGLSFFTH
jgi:outer membrane protein with beta-barrel domain